MHGLRSEGGEHHLLDKARRQLTGEGTAGMVPVFILEPFDGRGAQLCPCRLATGTPQAFPVASPPGDLDRPGSSPLDERRADARGSPAQIRQVRAGGVA